MRRAMVVAMLATVALVTPATATEPEIAGLGCDAGVSYSSDGSDWVLEIHGGPIAVPDADTVTLTCTAKAGSATLATTTGSGPSVAVAPPEPFTATADSIAVCTRVTVTRGATTTDYYWDHPNARYTTDAGAGCGPYACILTRVSCGEPDPIRILREYLGPVLEELERAGDDLQRYVWSIVGPLAEDAYLVAEAAICAALLEFPDQPGLVETDEQGDAYVGGTLVWDCPPYAGS